MRAGAQGEMRSVGEVPTEGWLARLELDFDRPRERTVLRRNAHRGPLRVQRPFHPEGEAGPCHVYLLHPPGGVVGSDRIELTTRVGRGAWALITTPGAGKLYRTRGPLACIDQRLFVDAGARAEFLPQETIAFDGADARLSTQVELAQDAYALGWDILCLGRPAAGERFTRGRIRQRLEIARAGRLCFVERATYEGGSPVLQAAWGLGERPVVATFWCTPADEALRDAVREACGSLGAACAFTLVNGVLVGRCLAAGSHLARAAFERAWRAVRLHLDGREPHPPRVWNT